MFNLALQHRPDQVRTIGADADLPAVVRTAAERGTRLHPIGRGHGFGSPIEGGIALLTDGLAGVEVDAACRTARIGAGSSWADVLAAATPYGLAPLCGSAPDVGVIGYLLGGGLSPIGRTFGWASDFVRSFEVVTGRGEVVIASAESHEELFWSLRGGKRSPGLVTAVEIDLLPLSTLYGGGLYFDGADADQVLTGYAAWSAQVPDSVTSSCALLRLPDLDLVPEPLRSRFVVHIRVAVVDEPPAAAAVIAPLRELARPLIDSVAEMPFAGIGSIHADPNHPVPVLEAGALLTHFDAAAARALLAVAGPATPAPFAAVEIRHLGGALAHGPTEPDAVAGRDAAYGVFVVSAPVPELFEHVVPAATARLLTALEPWSTGTVQPNFSGTLNGPHALDDAWPAEVRDRLAEVSRRYDPAGIFTS